MKKTLTLLALTAALLAAQTAAPMLSLDGNGATVLTLYKGWPLFLHGILSHSLRAQRGETPPLLLAPAASSWADSVSIAMFTSDRQVSWPLERLGSADADALTVPKKGRVPMTWWLTSARTAELEPGVYALAALIEVRDSRGWNGKVRSAPVVITVEDAPAEMTPALETALALLRAREAIATGSPNRAAGILLERLDRSPDNVALAASAAGYLEAAGSLELAYAVAEAALQNFHTAAQPGAFSPVDLVELRNRLALRIHTPRP